MFLYSLMPVLKVKVVWCVFCGLKVIDNHISFTTGQPVAWQLMFASIVIDM